MRGLRAALGAMALTGVSALAVLVLRARDETERGHSGSPPEARARSRVGDERPPVPVQTCELLISESRSELCGVALPQRGSFL